MELSKPILKKMFRQVGKISFEISIGDGAETLLDMFCVVCFVWLAFLVELFQKRWFSNDLFRPAETSLHVKLSIL